MGQKKTHNRRSVLKSLTVGTVLSSSTISVVSANRRREQEDSRKRVLEDLDRAYEIKHEDGQKAKEDFLEDKGYQHGWTSIKSNISLGKSTSSKDADDNVSIEDIEDPQDGGIRAELSGTALTDDRSEEYEFILDTEYDLKVECENNQGGFTYDPEYISYGEGPKDAAGLMWENLQESISSLLTVVANAW